MAYGNTGLFNVAAGPGMAAGQGLMNLGQAFTGTMELERQRKKEEEREQLTKTLALINLYTKMGDDLAPADRQNLYTGALIPMLAQAGAFPKGSNVEETGKFIASLSAHTKEQMQGFREDNNKLIELVTQGKDDEARKFLSGMETQYGRLPGAAEFLKNSRKMLEDELAHRRGSTKEAQEMVLKGQAVAAKPGEEGAVDYGGAGLLIRGKTAKEKTGEAVEAAKAVKTAEIELEEGRGLPKKERERIELEHKNRMAELKLQLGTKQAEKKEKEVDQVVDDLLSGQLRREGIYKHKEKGWVYDEETELGEAKPQMVDVSTQEKAAAQFKTELLRRVAAEPDRAVRDIANGMLKEIGEAALKKEMPDEMQPAHGAAPKPSGLMRSSEPEKRKPQSKTYLDEPLTESQQEMKRQVETVKQLPKRMLERTAERSPRKGLLGGERPGRQAPEKKASGKVPESERQSLIDELKKGGFPATEENIEALYRRDYLNLKR